MMRQRLLLIQWGEQQQLDRELHILCGRMDGVPSKNVVMVAIYNLDPTIYDDSNYIVCVHSSWDVH